MEEKTEREGLKSLSSVFQLGRQAGREEVVRWADEFCDNETHKPYPVNRRAWMVKRRNCPDCWEAKLKEWGITIKDG